MLTLSNMRNTGQIVYKVKPLRKPLDSFPFSYVSLDNLYFQPGEISRKSPRPPSLRLRAFSEPISMELAIPWTLNPIP